LHVLCCFILWCGVCVCGMNYLATLLVQKRGMRCFTFSVLTCISEFICYKERGPQVIHNLRPSFLMLLWVTYYLAVSLKYAFRVRPPNNVQIPRIFHGSRFSCSPSSFNIGNVAISLLMTMKNWYILKALLSG